jgi:hypothetical protein
MKKSQNISIYLIMYKKKESNLKKTIYIHSVL